MPTKPKAKPAKKTGVKKGAAKKGGTKGKGKSQNSRASNEELDRLATQVVDLRDNKGLAWGDIREKLDIAPSRLRQLYNRGGGEPTRERKGSAKTKTGAAGKKGKGKGKTRAGKKRANPSGKG